MNTENNIDQILCQNCEIEHDIEFKFCPHCGQQTKEDLTVGVLFYNTISNYFSFDARFLKSFLPLVFKPGVLAKRFVSGKRLTYLHPAQMYLFISVIFFFLYSFKVREYSKALDNTFSKGFELEQQDSLDVLQLDSVDVAKLTKPLLNSPNVVAGIDDEEIKALDSTLNSQLTKPVPNNFRFGYDTKKMDSLITIGAPEIEKLKLLGMKEDAGLLNKTFYRQWLKFHERKGTGILQPIVDSIPISLFVLLPIFALLFKIFYWRRGRFAHHLVFSFYYFSFLFSVMSFILLLNYAVAIPDWIDFLIALSTFFYLVIASRNYYEQGIFVSFIKSSMITFIYMMFVAPIAIGIVLVLGALFY
jgi:hypothetical protein